MLTHIRLCSEVTTKEVCESDRGSLWNNREEGGGVT